MKRIQGTVIVILIFSIVAGVVGACAMQLRPDSLLALIDSEGNYSEEAFAANLAKSKEDGLTVFDNENTGYVIIYPQNAESTLTAAVEDMVLALGEISGADFAAYDDSRQPSAKEICVGDTNRPFGKADSFTNPAAYYLATEGERIFIYSSSPYGASNGIYGFLEDYLGVMYMDKEYTYYPELKKAVLSPIDDFQSPAFEVRDICASAVSGERQRRRFRLTCGEVFDSNGCHNSLQFIPVSKYFNEHPEYFALLGGQRRSGTYMFQGPQLCWSNSEVVELLADAAAKRVQDYEERGGTRVIYWDFSQMDSMNRCECENCRALENLYKSPIAPILLAVNEIARQFPNSCFSTLAYHYGSKPPVNLVPEPNVLIKYCFMSEFGANDLSAPVGSAESDVSKRHYSEINEWGEITDNIYVWDYVTNYFNYLLPFPCLGSLQGNLQIMENAGVRGVFSLGAYTDRGSSESIKSYLISKLLWNPDYDYDFLMSKYLTLYYGPAAPHIRQIYELQRKYLDGKLWVYDLPLYHMDDYLSEEAMSEYTAILYDAFEAAAGNEAIAKRLRYEQLSLTYVNFKLGYGDKTAMQTLLVSLCDEFGIQRFDEVGSDLVAKYRK